MTSIGAAAGTVVAVAASPTHTMSKPVRPSITLVAGHGVEGDAHAGATVKHRSRVAVDPTVPNLRQVHLVHAELLVELRDRGFDIAAGVMGENVLTLGIDLLALTRATRLHFSGGPIVEITGLRNPCAQLDGLKPGLMAALIEKTVSGAIIRKAGVMGIVVRGGPIAPGCGITVDAGSSDGAPLDRV